MKKFFLTIILLFILNLTAVYAITVLPPYIGCSGHNCSLDGSDNLYARWLFENDATDSTSKSNDLSSNGTPTYGTSSPSPKEGTYRLDLDSGDYLYRTDANLSSGYPLKSGDTQKICMVCAWVDADSMPSGGASYTLYSKYASTGDKRSFAMAISESGGTVYWALYLGKTNGTDYDAYVHATTDPSTDTWYFACMGVDTSDVYIYLRDSSGAVIGSDYSTSLLNALSIEDVQVEVGTIEGGNNWIGQMDEMLVFDRILTVNEVTDLAKGTF